MKESDARREFPIWASTPLPEPDDMISRLPRRMRIDEKLHEWKKRYTIMLVCSVALAIWTAGWVFVTGVIVRHNTELEVTERVSAEKESEFASRIFVADDESIQNAIDADTVWLARLGQGVLNTYSAADIEDAKKAMICAICRVYSPGEFGEFAGIGSIVDAVNQKDQWWGYRDNLPYSTDVETAARAVSTMFHKQQPMPCSPDMVYASWNGSDIVLRNKWKDNSSSGRY